MPARVRLPRRHAWAPHNGFSTQGGAVSAATGAFLKHNQHRLHEGLKQFPRAPGIGTLQGCSIGSPDPPCLLGRACGPRNFMKKGGACFSLPVGRRPAMPPRCGFSPLLGWAFRPRNPMKNRGAANPGCGPAFEWVQPAESRLQARLPAPHRWHRGHAGGFSTLPPVCRLKAPIRADAQPNWPYGSPRTQTPCPAPPLSPRSRRSCIATARVAAA
jgi:hypothetical protein